MTIDTKRLAADAAYWGECGAPEWATKFGFAGRIETPVWYSLESYQHAEGPLMNRVFRFANEGTYNLHQIGRMISRPTKKPEVEWDGEGLPPVGVECEVSYAGYWVRAKVVHLTAIGSLVCEMFDEYRGKVRITENPQDFRPIRTKEQRQKDDLAKLINDSQMALGSFWTPEKAAEVIIFAGWKRDV